MKFEDFIRKNLVKKASRDMQLAKYLIDSTDNDLEFLKTLPINEVSARKVFTNYYDCLRSVLEALAALEGYKVYSHEAFTYYLKEKSEESASSKFERFRMLRNKINYYGKSISVEEVKEYKEDIIELIKKIKERLK